MQCLILHVDECINHKKIYIGGAHKCNVDTIICTFKTNIQRSTSSLSRCCSNAICSQEVLPATPSCQQSLADAASLDSPNYHGTAQYCNAMFTNERLMTLFPPRRSKSLSQLKYRIEDTRKFEHSPMWH